MHVGKLVFAQLTEHLPLTTFRRCVALYAGEHKIKNFTCLEQFLCLAFTQLTYRESLRDIEACLRAQRDKLYHMGIRSRVSRSTLASPGNGRAKASFYPPSRTPRHCLPYMHVATTSIVPQRQVTGSASAA